MQVNCKSIGFTSFCSNIVLSIVLGLMCPLFLFSFGFKLSLPHGGQFKEGFEAVLVHVLVLGEHHAECIQHPAIGASFKVFHLKSKVYWSVAPWIGRHT